MREKVIETLRHYFDDYSETEIKIRELANDLEKCVEIDPLIRSQEKIIAKAWLETLSLFMEV